MGAGHNRRIRLRHAEAFQQLIYLGIGFYIYPGEEHAIPGEKIAYPKRIRGIARPDHTQADEVRRLAYQLSARDKSLENKIAQAGALI